MKKTFSLLSKIDYNKLWLIPFTFILIWIFFLCLLDSRFPAFNPIVLLLLVIVNVIFLCFLFKKLSTNIKRIDNKKTMIFYAVITVLMVLLQFLIGYKTRTNPTWDLGINITAANEILENGHMTNSIGYYLNFPNNIFNTLVLAVLFKVFSFFGFHSGNGPMLVLNIFLIQLAIYFMFQVCRKIYGNLSACFALVLSLFFIPFYPYASICYTDTMSMFIPIGFIYYFIKISSNDKFYKNIIYFVIMGLLAFLAFQIKVTALIVLIAMFIIMVVKKEILKKGIMYFFGAIAIILATFLVTNKIYKLVVNKTNVLGVKYEETGLIPYTHWIMMGTYGGGAFSASEYDYTFSFPDVKTRKAANIKKVKQRLKRWKTQGYIKFLNNKMAMFTWGTGTYDFESILTSNAADNNKSHEFFTSTGRYYKLIHYFCQTYHFSMILFIIISLMYCLTRKENINILIMKLSMFGLLIFLLIWETRSRYMLNYIPIYILLMFSGINYLYKNYNRLLKKIFINKESSHEKR